MGPFRLSWAEPRLPFPDLDEIRAFADLLPRNPDGTWTPDLLKLFDRPGFLPRLAHMRVVSSGAGFVV